MYIDLGISTSVLGGVYLYYTSWKSSCIIQISKWHVLRSPCTKFGTIIPKIGVVRAIWSYGKKVWKYNTSVNEYQIFLHVVDGHEKTDFLC